VSAGHVPRVLTIGKGHGNPEMAMTPPILSSWVGLWSAGTRRPDVRHGVWLQPSTPGGDRCSATPPGLQGCLGRTLERIRSSRTGAATSVRTIRHRSVLRAEAETARWFSNNGANSSTCSRSRSLTRPAVVQSRRRARRLSGEEVSWAAARAKSTRTSCRVPAVEVQREARNGGGQVGAMEWKRSSSLCGR